MSRHALTRRTTNVIREQGAERSHKKAEFATTHELDRVGKALGQAASFAGALSEGARTLARRADSLERRVASLEAMVAALEARQRATPGVAVRRDRERP